MELTRNAECRLVLSPLHVSEQKKHTETSLLFWRLPVCVSVSQSSVRLGSVQLGQDHPRACVPGCDRTIMDGPHGRFGLSECQRFFLDVAAGPAGVSKNLRQRSQANRDS